MPGTAAGSLRQEQRRLARLLREQHKTWGEAAAALRERYSINARVAYRLVHGWSQREAADEWNARWPADPKTFKNFSYWELWPARTGHAPSLAVLSKLAELYECQLAELVADCADFRSHDAEFRTRADLARLPTLGAAGPPAPPEPASPHTNDHAAETGWLEPEDDRLAGLVAKVEQMSAEEVASAVASWAGHDGHGLSRRGLLLKLSAGLALAAAEPAFSQSEGSAGGPTVALPGPAESLAGIWHSKYSYYSSGQGRDLDAEHYVVLRQRDHHLIGQSLPHSTGSRVTLSLSVHGSIATGTWTEQTSPAGYYQGAEYHGTLQLIINPMGRAMAGRWLGYGRDFAINSGDWELTWVDSSVSASALRRYHLRA